MKKQSESHILDKQNEACHMAPSRQRPMSLPSFKDPSLTRLMILAVNLGAKTLKTYPWRSEIITEKATQQLLESCRNHRKCCGFGHDMVEIC